MDRERKTIRLMIGIYCRAHHGNQDDICESCDALLRYANLRLDHCPWGEAKPTCAKCPIHCYQPEMREQIKSVMRYAGPRMLLPHPWLTVAHLLDGLLSRKNNKVRY